MSAPGITYSGVLAKKNANESTDESTNESASGRVFKGTKFWISRRVPNHRTCVDTIHENGGTVVLREGNADILLCNPAKEPLPGSYSYHLIANAIQKGSLDIQENYLCTSATTYPRATKPTPHTTLTRNKFTRNKFTKEEDQLLVRYVTEQERLGEPTGGNNIYKNFAAKHPSHTWQSWRDRWTKRLNGLPRPPVTDRERSPRPDDTREALRQEVTAGKGHVSETRTRFTPEEDDILLETIHHAIENHEPWNGYEPYKRLADDFPQRTYTSWRERAMNHVAKQNRDQIAQWEFDAGFHPSDGEEVPKGSTEDQETLGKDDEVNIGSPTADHNNKNATVATITEPREEDDTHLSDDESGRKEEHQVVASSPMHRTNPPQSSPKEGVPAGSDPPNHSTPAPGLIIPRSLDDEIPITTKEQFYRDYNTFIESTGATNRFIPSVGGKAIALWDLWQSVRSKAEENLEPDWQQVAEDLGFDWIVMESVPNDLQQCYEEHLAPFADAMMSFNDSSDEDSVDDNADADAETERPLPSSPPTLPSLRRPPAIMSPVYQPLSPQPPTKRRRIDRSYEIPSTPENRNKKSHLPPLNNLNKSPAVSPLNRYKAVDPISRSLSQSSAVNGGNGEVEDSRTSTSVQRQGRKRRLEPETQDFHFDADTQAHMHNEEDNDSQQAPSPSQQLLQESDSVWAMRQHDTPASAIPRQKKVQATPTPRRSSDSTRARRTRDSAGTERALPPTRQVQPKPRALPSSWKSGSPAPADPKIAQNGQLSPTTVLGSEPPRKSTRPQETPDDIIDHFVSLGYGRDIVLRSLKATSWVIGNAGQVMEMMKQGGPLPPRTTGVWTQRDDDALALVFSNEPPSDEKEEKKRAKEMRRLQAKHGAEQIALRKTYLLDELPE